MNDAKSDVPYGTLDLLILKTLETLGPLHGFGSHDVSSRCPRIL